MSFHKKKQFDAQHLVSFFIDKQQLHAWSWLGCRAWQTGLVLRYFWGGPAAITSRSPELRVGDAPRFSQFAKPSGV
jgi:hypothetical protein